MLDAKTQFCLTKESLTPYLRGKKKRKKEKGGKKKEPCDWHRAGCNLERGLLRLTPYQPWTRNGLDPLEVENESWFKLHHDATLQGLRPLQ